MTTNQFQPGNIVEWWDQPASIATGIIGNVPPVRRIGRVSHSRRDYDGEAVVIYDPDGVRCVRHADQLAVIAEHGEAGWGRL